MPTPTATIFLPYHALDDVILRGTRAAQPAASAVVAGTLYGVTDEGNLVERSTGTVWQAYSPTGGGGGAPAAHHATHEPGGTDPLAVDAAAATGSLRTLGPGATQAAPGNDARFAAGTAAHHVSHEPGGSDALVNAAWTNQPNVFTEFQTIQKDFAAFKQIHPSGLANQRAWQLVTSGADYQLQPIDDAGTPSSVVPLVLDRTGNFRLSGTFSDYNRPTPIGHWVNVTPSLSASAGTVTLNTTNNYRYMLLGKTCVFSFFLVITLSATPTTVTLNLPAGIVNDAGYATMPFSASFGTGIAQVSPGTGTVALYRDFAVSAWPTGLSSLAGTLTLPIT